MRVSGKRPMNGSNFLTAESANVRDVSKRSSRLHFDVSPPKSEADELTASVESFRPRRARPKSRTTIADEVIEMATRQNWANAGAQHVVALAGEFHRRVYGVEAEELRTRARQIFVRSADSMIKQNGVEWVVEFVKWVWKREQERETWRRDNHKQGSRVSIAMVFGSSNLRTEYRI